MLILHGENTVFSRKELNSLKEKNNDKEIIFLNGKNLKLTELKEALETQSLFGMEKLIIIENFLSKLKNLRSGTKNPEINYLIQQKHLKNLIFWEDKEINKSLLSLFKKAEIKFFKVERLVFSLVESIKPNNAKVVIDLFKKILLKNPMEIIFSMIIRQFRLLILIKSGTKNGPLEFLRLAPWQKQKLTNQAKFFTMEELRKIYKRLLEIDYNNKTGQSCFDLAKTLELFIIEI